MDQQSDDPFIPLTKVTPISDGGTLHFGVLSYPYPSPFKSLNSQMTRSISTPGDPRRSSESPHFSTHRGLHRWSVYGRVLTEGIVPVSGPPPWVRGHVGCHRRRGLLVNLTHDSSVLSDVNGVEDRRWSGGSLNSVQRVVPPTFDGPQPCPPDRLGGLSIRSFPANEVSAAD